MNPFSGSIVPLITPFTKENAIDKEALHALVEWHIHEGSDAIICLGTTGEAPTLDREEKILVVKACLEAGKKKIPIFVGTGTNNTKESVEFTKIAKELKADGCMAIVPYYNKPTPRGCLEHFRALARVGLPLLLYHHPGRTGTRLPVTTLAQMHEETLILAVKELTLDLDYIKALRKISPLPILSGDEDFSLPIIKEGGVGAICVLANIFPKEWKEVVSLALKGKLTESTLLANRYAKLIHTLSLETNPGPVKFFLSLMGKSLPYLRLPLVEPEEEIQGKLREVYGLFKPYFAGNLEIAKK